ncbi:hypothetical protein AMATHDRAFT_85722 [Amanita thiersii Skay4041]|uniref:Uncharacterized protein n=1 Tax=Amanita thiersii Skay4041 TaxID=703135 RepID=A0A2A9NK97_9AGAR|nr:hypothetical protein AMATHDRAFT_85722 [Amanita thiersii Skay4041]
MSSYTTFYQVPPYTQQTNTIPKGWQPPFQGPPPLPSGMNVNPQLWQAGRWQFNPAYLSRNQAPIPPNQHTWVAGQAWQQRPPGEAASKNPYKRVPKPFSPTYLATSLSDNPLGLSDMIPAEEYYAQQPAASIPTDDERRPPIADSPWIWNPPQLAPEEDESTDVPAPVARPDRAERPTPSRQQSTETATQQQQQQQETSAQRESPKKPELSKDDVPFTAKRDLVPTFSINIVRTPEHYKLAQSRSSSRSSLHPSTSRSATIDPQQLADRMQTLSTSEQPKPLSRHYSMPDTTSKAPIYEPNSAPAAPSSVYVAAHLVDEPTNSLLSPLLINTPKSSNRSLGRNSTFPVINSSSSLDPIPEASSVSRPDQQQPSHHRPHKSSHRTPLRNKAESADSYFYNTSPNHPSPTHPSHSSSSPYNASPSRSSRSSSSSRASSQQPSPATSLSLSPHDYHTSPPTSSSSRQSNPLPVPPTEHSNLHFSSLSQSGSGAYTTKKRVRKGYWNKRGDHVTMSGFIVYPPSDHLYPSELQDYPDEKVGYLDEKGHFLPFSDRPELPESLPHRGQAPRRPYTFNSLLSQFLEYV